MSVSDILRKFRDDESGSSTVEFVIWVPLLSFWLIFSTALYLAWENRARAAKAAYTISDLVSRKETVNSDFLQQVSDLHDRLVTLRTNDDASNIRISSLIYDGGEYVDGEYVGGELQVQWSCGSDGWPGLTSAEIPVDLIPTMSPLDTVILTESAVSYTPIPIPFVFLFDQTVKPEDVDEYLTENYAEELNLDENPLGPDETIQDRYLEYQESIGFDDLDGREGEVVLDYGVSGEDPSAKRIGFDGSIAQKVWVNTLITRPRIVREIALETVCPSGQPG